MTTHDGRAKAFNSSTDIPVRHFEPRPVRVFEAHYVPETSPLHTGNPLIDALPTIKSDAEWIAQLAALPKFDPSQRALESYLRSYKVSQLKHIFIPTGEHRLLARRLDQIIRWGYENRPPHSTERDELLQKSYAHAQSQGKATRLIFDASKPICTFSLIGCSGTGKSTAKDAIVGSYAQCILHPRGNVTQVVWLTVDCPRNGGVGDLALAIVQAFDRVLGTDYASQCGERVNANVRMAIAAHLAVAHHLGVLLLDEMQNLSVKKSGGREEMLNWFQQLVNDFKMPIVLFGTYKVTKVLQLDLRHARRAGVTGSFVWNPLPKGPEFEYLLTKLWKYMWLREAGELTQELRDAIYEETQGIRSFIVDMFLIVQLHALWKGVEKITPELFKKVARTEFAPVQPMLNALRSKDPNRLNKFEDIQFDVNSEIDQLRQLIGVSGAADSPSLETSMVGEATTNLQMAFGVPAVEARQLVLRALQGSHESVRALTEAAVRLFMDERDGSKCPKGAAG